MWVTARVIKVIDGDTFTVTGDTIRLADVDAPELDEPSGLQAKQRLRDLIEGKDVEYEEQARDVYGRIVAEVWVGNVDVNATMRSFVRTI